jgi:hypothetical protein
MGVFDYIDGDDMQSKPFFHFLMVVLWHPFRELETFGKILTKI